MAGTLRLSNTGTGNGQSTITTAASGDTTYTLPSGGGTFVTTASTEALTVPFASGTAGAPSVTFIGDTDTGLYSPSANNVAISTNGAGRLFVDSSGNVLLGRSTLPSAGWPVAVHAGLTAASSDNSVQTQLWGYDGVAGIGTYTNTDFQFRINNSERMRLDTSGRLGLGNSSPASPFHLGSSSISAGTGHYQQIETAGNTMFLGIGTDNSANINSNGILKFGAGSHTTRMTIDTSGQVGIGTTSPGRKLEISTAVDDGIEIIETSSGNAKRVRILNSSTGTIYNATAGVGSGTHQFQIDGGEALRIDGSKRLLVGTSTDSVATAGVHVYNNTNGGRINNIKTGSGLYDSIANYHSGSYVGGLTYSNTATALVTSSDVRLKTNIQDSISAIGIVEQVRVVSHDWVNDDSSVRFGFVAQELNNVLPEAVRVGDDGDDIQQTWGVDYARLVPVLTKALQEAITRIETLEAKVQALKGA